MDSFRFFDLPPEIRNLVYAEYAKCVQWELRDCIAGFCLAVGEIRMAHADLEILHRPSGLLRTSRQLRTEMLEHLLLNKPLSIDPLGMEDPSFTLRNSIPVGVRQNLWSVDIDIDNFATSSLLEFSLFTEWLCEVFPRLRQVTIREFWNIDVPFELEPVWEDATSHAAIVKSYVRKTYYATKILYEHYQSKRLALNMDIKYFLDDDDLAAIHTCWVRLKMTMSVDLLT